MTNPSPVTFETATAATCFTEIEAQVANGQTVAKLLSHLSANPIARLTIGFKTVFLPKR